MAPTVSYVITRRLHWQHHKHLLRNNGHTPTMIIILMIIIIIKKTIKSYQTVIQSC